MPTGQKTPAPNSTHSLVPLDNTVNGGIQYSKVIAMPFGKLLSIMLAFPAGLTTSAILQKTNIPNPVEDTDDDWVTETGVTFTGASGTAATELQELNDAGAFKYRVKFTTTVGADGVNVYAQVKSEK